MKTHLIAYICMLLIATIIAENTSPIHNNQEYQVVLTSSDFSSAEMRDATISEFEQIMEDNGIPISQFSKTISLRTEGVFKVSGCKLPSGSYMRRRDWVDLDLVGQTSIDLKIAPTGMTRSEALDADATPADNLESQSIQDVEEDEHYCLGSDWSRSTKIFYGIGQTAPDLTTCKDVRSLFPNTISSKYDDVEVTLNDNSGITYYIEYLYDYPSGDSMRIQFDLFYDNEEDALNGVNFKSGEFSMTPSSYVWPFETDFENSVRQSYQDIISQFGSPGEDNCDSAYFDSYLSSASSKNNNDKSSNNSSSNNDSSASSIHFSAILLLVVLSFLI